MRNFWMIMMAGLSLAAFSSAAEKTVNLSGTWVLDVTQSDSPQPRQSRRMGGFPGIGGVFPGIGGGYPGGGYPGGGYPGGGYPGSRPAGQYPGDDPDGGEGMPRGQMQNLTMEIVQTDNEVQTTRKFTVNGEEQTIAQKFALDGTQSSNPASNGRGEFVSTSTWKNDKLVNLGTQTTTVQGQSTDTTVKEEYSLSKDGKTLTIKTTRTTPRGNSTSKQVFKQSSPSES